MGTTLRGTVNRCFIVPPHILEYIVDNSSEPELRQRALRNLYQQGQLRGVRIGMGQYAFGGLATGTKRRTIYDAGHGTALPGVLVRSEEQRPTDDRAVNEAYDYSGYTYDFYLDVLARNSVDGQGMRLDSTVHYGSDYDNAFWNGQQMVYGDGDGDIFLRFTCCLDVVAHELTHGVTQFTARLEYHDQPGAINESMSDVFGTLVKQYQMRQSAQEADWLIGEGILVPKDGVNRRALRSMKAPGTAYDDPGTIGTDPQPSHMSDYHYGSGDNGGVHINSGIPNHAFYLAATAIGGHAWEIAGRIWYEALTTRLSSAARFADLAAATRELAVRFGSTSVRAVDHAWLSVGL